MINDIISQIDSYVWGLPLIILIMACGILLTFRLRFLQVRKLGKALPNVVAIILLSGVISDETKDYFTRLREGKIKE